MVHEMVALFVYLLKMPLRQLTKCGPNCQKLFQFHPTNVEFVELLSLKTTLVMNLVTLDKLRSFVNSVRIFVTFLIT